MRLAALLMFVAALWASPEIGAQDLEILDNRITAQAVAELPGLTKDVIFQRARHWFRVVRANAGAQVTSESQSAIHGQYTRSYTTYGRDFVHYITLETKDEKLRYTVTRIGNGTYGELEDWLLKKNNTEWRSGRKKFYKQVETALRNEFTSLVNDVQYEGLLAKQETAELADMTSDQIHTKVKAWLVETHGDAAINNDTPTRISGHYTREYLGFPRPFGHGIIIDIEDGQIRYTVTHLAGDGCGDLAAWLIRKRNSEWNVIYRKFRDQVATALTNEFEDLVKHIESEDEW